MRTKFTNNVASRIGLQVKRRLLLALFTVFIWPGASFAQTYFETPCVAYLSGIGLAPTELQNPGNSDDCSDHEKIVLARLAGEVNAAGFLLMHKISELGGETDSHTVFEIARRYLDTSDERFAAGLLFFQASIDNINHNMKISEDQERYGVYQVFF